MITEKQEIIVNSRVYSIVNELGKGKSGISYLCNEADKLVTIKKLEKSDLNYIPFEEALNVEINSYKKLIQIGIRIPKLIDYDPVNNCIVKEYISGDVLMNLIAKGKISSHIWREIFMFSKMAYDLSFNLDYFPTNYIYSGKELYYIDYEVHNYSDEWDFENWGLYYWANIEGVKKYLETNDATNVHVPNTNYKPVINDSIDKMRTKLIKQFSQIIK